MQQYQVIFDGTERTVEAADEDHAIEKVAAQLVSDFKENAEVTELPEWNVTIEGTVQAHSRQDARIDVSNRGVDALDNTEMTVDEP